MNDLPTLTSRISRHALPSDKHTYTFELSTLRSAHRQYPRNDILTFDLTLNHHDFAVSLMTSETPYLLIFNLKHTRRQPLAFKIYSGFRIATFYHQRDDRIRIRDFFGIDVFKTGSFKSLFLQMNAALKLRTSQAEISDRQALLQLQDDPEDIDKIYFDGWRKNSGKRQDGTPVQRSSYNAWKTQQILPSVWLQIADDPTTSVRYTATPLPGADVIATEAALIKKKLANYHRGKAN